MHDKNVNFILRVVKQIEKSFNYVRQKGLRQ
jgi:hypothetical protein